MENPCKIVCFGDSITKGYCNRFERKIKKEYSDLKIDVINMGAVSETSVDGLRRLDQVIALEPDVVVVGFGMNDWRKGVEKETFRKNLGFIVEELDRRGIRVILMTMNPDFNQEGRVSKQLIEYNEIIKDVAHEKRVRIADVYSLWMKELPNIREGLYDEIHPNERVGNEVICKALIRVVPRSHIVVAWAFNGMFAFCNYKCEYCYVPSEVSMGHHFQGDINEWHDAFKNTFGNQKLVFYLSYGEPMVAKSFYDVVDMIASEPNWFGHITSNLSVPLEKLVGTKLVKEGRLNINGSFHPTETSIDKFLDKLLFLREHGIECPVVFVMWPPFIDKFEEWFKIFDEHNFLVHIRRFRGLYNGKLYPKAYTDEQRQFIAKYCDDATIKYMLNDFEIDVRGKLTYAGMDYIYVDNRGDVYTSPDSRDKYHGNIFKGDVKLFTEPQPYGLNWNGTVNGVASILELNYRQLENNFVMSFARQGGVYHTEKGVYYKNMNTDFNNPKIRQEYNFPLADKGLLDTVRERMAIECSKGKQYAYREIYARLVVGRNTIFRLVKRPKKF
jgi:acyl-CoA thioesterase-1